MNGLFSVNRPLLPGGRAANLRFSATLLRVTAISTALCSAMIVLSVFRVFSVPGFQCSRFSVFRVSGVLMYVAGQQVIWQL